MAKWIKAEVTRLIAEGLVPTFAPVVFKYKKSASAFARKIDGGRQEFGIAIVDYNPVFHFSFHMVTRIDAVQEITNQFSWWPQPMPERFRSQTVPSITQLEHLGLPAGPGRCVDWKVSSESELAAILPTVREIVDQRVMPFFDEFKSVEAINRGLNPPDAEHQFEAVADRLAFDATNYPYRAMTGVAAAYVARDPRLPRLIAAYRTQMQGAREPDLKKFEELVAHLLRG